MPDSSRCARLTGPPCGYHLNVRPLRVPAEPHTMSTHTPCLTYFVGSALLLQQCPPPAVAYGQPGAGTLIPGGATLLIEVELLSVRWPNAMLSAPDVFSLIDSSADGELDEAEVRAHFHRLGKAVPETWAIEDTDRNGRISWEEFHGPKGVRPQTSPGVVQQ
mgnify:CR=1 FL=1